jgi:hypothetical protein
MVSPVQQFAEDCQERDCQERERVDENIQYSLLFGQQMDMKVFLHLGEPR